MFACGENRGVIVANAKAELREWLDTQPLDIARRVQVSEFAFADGVLDAINKLLEHEP